jgi:hypothetical protein
VALLAARTVASRGQAPALPGITPRAGALETGLHLHFSGNRRKYFRLKQIRNSVSSLQRNCGHIFCPPATEATAPSSYHSPRAIQDRHKTSSARARSRAGKYRHPSPAKKTDPKPIDLISMKDPGEPQYGRPLYHPFTQFIQGILGSPPHNAVIP